MISDDVQGPEAKPDDGTTDHAPMPKSKSTTARASHITEQPVIWSNWHQHTNWLNCFFILFVPLVGCIGAYWAPLHPHTALFALIYYFNVCLGITAGYHRCWAHCSYKATLPLKLYLAAVGVAAGQGSIRWWARGHRVHHRYTDTEKGPYSKVGRTDVTDLDADPVVVWQHKHYIKTALFMSLILQTLLCGLGWVDWQGGLIYAGILRAFFIQQTTFFVNSLAHWLGEQPFDDRNAPRDYVITALVTLGEGYHNLHHEFPSDYLNAIQWWQYDKTKWMIWIWKELGLAYDLKQFCYNEIEKGRLQQLQKKVDQKRATLDWASPSNNSL
ncbi:stearoyl-CoA 9-desaturase [Aspergillus fumigatus]|nr:stearoyl-CoA 9-desaturase [Aspergillus fumigatus]